ncbi:MAG TPA: hypothetical protein EYP04_05185 [Anaerolineae bacterium]|nr:hypothetical protein [Anaerolineae bacterium]
MQKYFADEGFWLTWGMLYENVRRRFQDCPLLIRSIPEDDRATGRYFTRRTQELQPPLEQEELILGDRAGIFRFLPEIYEVEGQDYREIRQKLWERIFQDYPQPEPATVS